MKNGIFEGIRFISIPCISSAFSDQIDPCLHNQHPILYRDNKVEPETQPDPAGMNNQI